MGADIKPKLGLVGATSFVIGTIIGSGIFITANFMLRSVGSWGLSLIIWALSGVAALCGAICWAELATIFPKQGGTYIFIKEGLGDFPAFLYVSTRVFLLNPCSNAVQALASAEYLMAPLSPCPPTQAIQTTAICLLLLMTFLHCYSTTLTSNLNTVITAIKLLTLLAITIAGFITLAKSPPSFSPPFEGTSSSMSSYVTAIYGGYWSYAGWQGIPAGIEDIKDPRRTFPKAIVCGLVIVTISYLLVNIAFLLVLSTEEIKTSSLLVSTFSSHIAGSSLATPFSLLVFISLFGSFLGAGFINGRFCFAASREHHLPKFLSFLHQHSNTPVTAQMMHAVITLLLLCVTSRIGLLLRLFVFVSVGFDILVLCSFFMLRYRKLSPEPAFKTPLIIPILYTLFLMTILVIPIIKDQDMKLLIPLVFLVTISFLYVLIIRKKLLSNLVNFSKLERLLCNLLLLVPVEEHTDEHKQ
eukprot:GFUD01033635.1.p1 GENE.GFUD01033635.1~~GFUD01033635.1.p1  ORF type:complete len:470 (-),score=82.28 GFUD01033635.1:92-1501(-)